MSDQKGLVKKVMSIFSFDADSEDMEDLQQRTDERPERGSDKVVAIKRQVKHAEISIFSPQSFDDASMIANNLKSGKAVIINLGRLDVSLATRIVDFVSGIIYALEGESKKVGDNIFVFTPYGISIAAESEVLGAASPDHGNLFFADR
jgi:cell division inhibitor SepF